jgi:adhesin/invasin
VITRIHVLLAATLVAVASGVTLAAPLRAVGGSNPCPASNRPNMLAILGGSSQTAQLGKAFQTNLQVALANSNGCPLTGSLAGISIDFVAPTSGASGTFASSASNVAVVGTDAQGVAVAPLFTANDTAGAYSVHAESDYGSVKLYLTNTAHGVASTIAGAGPTEQSATVLSRYAESLQATVLDAGGEPVQGASVAFTLGASASGAGASFVGGGAQATALTDASGLATSPSFSAGSTAGRFTATATTAGVAVPVSFSLLNVAGRPAAIAAGVAANESTRVSSRFPIRLAVTVTDANDNPVVGVRVTFAAPARGPSGHFGTHGARAVRVTTNASGVAVAPVFIAGRLPGGYVVTASVGGASRAAAFALVNER